jgi:hypothetical protein
MFPSPTTPQNTQEVASAWRTELGTPCITRSANFFEAGGDSLSALRVCRRLAERLRALGFSSKDVSQRQNGIDDDFDVDNAKRSVQDGGKKGDHTQDKGYASLKPASNRNTRERADDSGSKASKGDQIEQKTTATPPVGEFGETLGTLNPAELLKRPDLVVFAAYLRKEFGDGTDADTDVHSNVQHDVNGLNLSHRSSAVEHASAAHDAGAAGEGALDSKRTNIAQDSHKINTQQKAKKSQVGKVQEADKDRLRQQEAHSAEGLHGILLAAAGCGADEVVAFLLGTDKVDADLGSSRDGFMSPLLVACANGHEKAARLLCELLL